MKRMYAGRPGITFTTTPLGFSSGGGRQRISVALLLSLRPPGGMRSRRAEGAGILDTQNDVLDQPGFVLSLVLQHAEEIPGNGRAGRRLGCRQTATRLLV